MSEPKSHLDEWQGDELSEGARAEVSALADGIIVAAELCAAGVDPSRQAVCVRTAAALALTAVSQFHPKSTAIPQLKWCGPQGQPAPAITFPNDYVDRRTTVKWALYRMTVAMPVDEPIFSAQARVTMHHDGLATFTNFDRPAATVISNVGDQPVPRGLPDMVSTELLNTSTPLVYTVFNDMAAFDDVIFYTALFNFTRAFAAFQMGPWAALKTTLIATESIFVEQQLSVAERRVVEHAALAAVEKAWNVAWRQPLDQQFSALIMILALVVSKLPAC